MCNVLKCLSSSQAAVLAAAFAAHCDEVQPTPTNLFNAILIVRAIPELALKIELAALFCELLVSVSQC